LEVSLQNIDIVYTITDGRIIHFQWDTNKATKNFYKHGVSFEQALSCWNDPLAVEFEDIGSIDEPRYIRRGFDYENNLLLIVYSERIDPEIIRIISARFATLKERRSHEEGI
jgi:uncharacterized DUF497 family protein